MKARSRFAAATIVVMTGSHALAQTIPSRSPEAAGGEKAVETESADEAQGGGQPPLEGANSFTEDQARARIEGAGFAEVTALAKDERGVWRGAATKDGRSVKVALDYKGNVVQSP